MPRSTEIGVKNDGNQPNERFLFREIVVVVTVLGLALLNGINMAVRNSQVYIVSHRITSIWGIFQTAVPVPGLVFCAFLSEINGRKPIFVIIFVLSLISTILHAFPSQETCILLGLIVQGIVKGGTIIMTGLSITEYCSPKHRFTYMLAQAASHTVGYSLPYVVFSREVLSSSAYLQAFQVVLGVVLLGLTWVWPESPYWLASKGRLEESRKAFLWLRGEDGAKELRSVMEERRRPGPPKLFWMSLAFATVTISVSVFCNIQPIFASMYFHYYQREVSSPYDTQSIFLVCSSIVVFSLIAIISYRVQRKLLCLVISCISFLLCYAVALWLFLDPEVERSENTVFYFTYMVCDVLVRCGPTAFSIILCIEIIPQKYNTHMFCICLICHQVAIFLLITLSLYLFSEFIIRTYVYIVIYTTLSLGAVIFYYFLAPETRNKTLLEIQKMYTPEQRDEHPEQNQMMMQNIYEQIASTISSSRVAVLVGAAGCGKSTRAPLAALRGSGGDASVLVAGPRRVAAIGLARRVASELGEQVGETVGYQVRLDSKPPRPPAGSILYCTSGVLLRRLQTNPGLKGCTHVFIDEAHERDVNTDISLLLLKRAVDLNPDLRVIVMSATLDTEVFTRYYDSCPVIEVPGRTFPVETSYLEEIKQKYNLTLSGTLENCGKEESKPHVNCQEIVEVIKAVDRTEPEGAILVFLPGWAEIKQAKLLLDQNYSDTTHLILPVHSRLSTTDQSKMFARPLPGVRKIVLATNIAETSVTIPDVVYVVDSGAHKENRLKEGTGTACLDTAWVSQAGARQRAGRAGRVQPGHCYKLYTQEKENEFVPFTTPEILRVPLVQTVLDCKSYAPDEKVESLLSQLPEPPTRMAIELAVDDLVDLGALSSSGQLTRLGAVLSSIRLHPRRGRGLLCAALCGHGAPAAHLAAHCQTGLEVFVDAADRREEIREIKREFSSTSDYVALLRIQEQYERAPDGKAWCARYGLRRDRLNYVKAISNMYLEQLLRTPVFQPSPDFEELNLFSDASELTPAVLLCGTNELLTARAKLRTKGKLKTEVKLITSKGEHAHISSESVNHAAKGARGALFAHGGGFHSRDRRALVVRHASRVTPHAVLALCQGSVLPNETYDDTTVLSLPRHKLKIHVPTSQVDHILKIREMLSNTFQYYIERDPMQVSCEENTTVSRFKVELVKALVKMLAEAQKEFDGNTSADSFR